MTRLPEQETAAARRYFLALRRIARARLTTYPTADARLLAVQREAEALRQIATDALTPVSGESND